MLVGSGPFEHGYVGRIQTTRLSRLSRDEREEYESIIKTLDDPNARGKTEVFARLGVLASKTDQYDPMDRGTDVPGMDGKQGNQFHSVLKEAQELRRTGKLLDFGNHIRCPVAAIHGDYDPHPAEGVQKPLSATLKSFRFILLKDCGHMPWIERQAKRKFYNVLKEELSQGG